MANSPLSFASSDSFRTSLLNRNLPPYTVVGVYSPNTSDYDSEITQSNYSVIDSPDGLIANDTFASSQYVLNQYGPNGGYNINITYNGTQLPVNSNQGEYSPNDTVLDIVNEQYIDSSYVTNFYGPVGGYNDLVVFDNSYQSLGSQLHIPYGSNFVPSTYSPYSILLSANPNGDNGSLLQDSYLARIGAQQLKDAFQATIDRELTINTVGLVNLAALQDPFQASLLVTGQEPLVYKDWTITVPENPIVGVVDLITKLGGAYWPVSLIPGDYFDSNTPMGQSSQTSTALNVVNHLTGGALGSILNKKRNPSEIFLANTGNGQRSALFRNISYNRYQPGYDNTYGGILGIGQTILDLTISAINPTNGTLVGGYYVGNKNSSVTSITSPPNQVPVNVFGQQESSPVYGPSEVGILFEGNQDTLNFGLAGKTLSDGGGVDGQFVWTSPKSNPSAGYHATPGGGQGSQSTDYQLVSSNITKDSSTNFSFKETSILDETQRLVNSADNVQGVSKLKHVGNAINQLSKVFHDGYKEITKGSKVLSYKDQTTGSDVGIEYCRVFTKDTPYYTYNDLQKTDGITTSGRRFTNSVLDNTYNLNIAPLRNPGSTNIIPDNDYGLGGYAKKYMFSIENLAWRTSSRPGYTYDELPVCEKGPNGGRVMWFPPYGLSFSDTSSADWQKTPFLGRPEPMYTYKHTTRTGTLSWLMIVDHPSVMNVITEKQLKGQNNEKINSILDSFFAGCVKYDIYTLAQKHSTISSKDLLNYQQILNSKPTKEDILAVNNSIPANNNVNTDNIQNSNNGVLNNDTSINDFQNMYKEFAFYFENDIPGPSTSTISSQDFLSTYNDYVFNANIDRYQANANTIFNEGSMSRNTTDFFNNVIIPNFNTIAGGDKNFINDAYNILNEKKGTISIDILASASAPATTNYNVNLSKRRYDSVIKYLKTTKLAPFIDNKTFTIKTSTTAGEQLVVPISPTGFGTQIDCHTDIKAEINPNDVNNKTAQVYSVNAMACRRVKISNIKVTPVVQPKPEDTDVKIIKDDNIKPIFPKTEDVTKKLKDGISKKILRQLLSECDYFEVIKESNPMIYDSIKEKVKYFNPSFHSMTPEGLNGRLTFLNQCLRPGETIPVLDTLGNPTYNDAINTSFGAPPVLILRIGDFYHTKIIPNSLNIQYEPLMFDMNPEGIGVQPMLAKISMGIDIIGGMGLAKPVEELQNALSFNYYGNTEIYDERATWTEDTSAFDKVFLQDLLSTQSPVNINNITNSVISNGGNTIGEILTNIPNSSGDTGLIDYKNVMNKILENTKDYYSMVMNKSESITNSYNYGVWQMITQDRLYTDGEFVFNNNSNLIQIYGKSNNIEKKTDELFIKLIDDIEADNPTNNNFIIKKLVDMKFTNNIIQTVKTNLKNYITNYKNDFTSGIFTTMQELTTQQQNMIQYFRQVNLIDTLTDGKIKDNSTPVVYNLSGTTEVDSKSKGKNYPTPPTNTYEELWMDYRLVGNNLKNFNSYLENNKIITTKTSPYNEIGGFTPFSNDSDLTIIENKRMFMVLAQIFNDKNKLTEFENTIIDAQLSIVKTPHNLKNKFNKICNSFQDIVQKELNDEKKFFTKLKKKKEYTDFVNTPVYSSDKLRKFSYTTVVNSSINEQQKSDILLLYKGDNTSDNTIWTNKTQFN